MTAQKPAQKWTVGRVLMWLAISFGLLFVAGVGTCAYFVVTNAKLRKVGAVFGETLRAGMAATKAPGTEALREAGCDVAAVIDLKAIRDLVEAVEEEGGDAKTKEVSDLDITAAVSCELGASSPTLTCEQVAKTYGKAVSQPSERFFVSVRRQLPPEDLCTGLYGPDGTLFEEVKQDDEQTERPKGGRRPSLREKGTP